MRVPEWETTPYSSEAASGYGTYESLADLFREIGHDGGVHKNLSLARCTGSSLGGHEHADHGAM